MNFGKFTFGSIEIDGKTYEHDVVIDHSRIRKRKKKPSRKFREEFGHTPVSVEEEIPWECRRLVVGSGKYGSLPVGVGCFLPARTFSGVRGQLAQSLSDRRIVRPLALIADRSDRFLNSRSP